MKLRASIPFRAYLEGDNPADLAVSTEFRHKDLSVRIAFVGDEPLALPAEPVKHVRRLRGFDIEVDGDETLKALAGEGDGWALLKLIADISNRVLTGVRNFGIVAHVEPLRASRDFTDQWLRVLNAEITDDGETWNRVRPNGTLEEMLADRFLLSSERVGELTIAEWKVAEEAIQDGLKAGPEREFFTNAVEHLRVGNLRMAVVESVICLEIVLSEWLHDILPQRGINRSKLKELLSPQIGLSTKLGLLLPLLLSASEREAIQEGHVLQTVTWRNGIVHKKGSLPDGIDSAVVRQGVSAVLALAARLADKRDRVRLAPKLRSIAEQVAGAHGGPLASIEVLGQHHYMIIMDFPLSEEFPDDAKLLKVAAALGEGLHEYDPRSRPAENVWIAFKQGTEIIARWGLGQLEKTGKQPLPSIAAILKIVNRPPEPRPEGSPEQSGEKQA